MERIEQKGIDLFIRDHPDYNDISVAYGSNEIPIEKQSIPALIEALKKYAE